MRCEQRLMAAIVSSVLAFALVGCADSPAAKMAPSPPQASRQGLSIDIFGMQKGSIPLETGLHTMGVPVLLPTDRTAGEVSRVLTATTGGIDGGTVPVLAVLYSSGIKLFVERQPWDFQGFGSVAGPFEHRQVDGVDVLATEPSGEQGSDLVRASLMWNSGGNGYRLIAPAGVTLQKLIDVMRSMEPTGDT